MYCFSAAELDPHPVDGRKACIATQRGFFGSQLPVFHRPFPTNTLITPVTSFPLQLHCLRVIFIPGSQERTTGDYPPSV